MILNSLHEVRRDCGSLKGWVWFIVIFSCIYQILIQIHSLLYTLEMPSWSFSHLDTVHPDVAKVPTVVRDEYERHGIRKSVEISWVPI
jgi:hypothetical protein